MEVPIPAMKLRQAKMFAPRSTHLMCLTFALGLILISPGSTEISSSPDECGSTIRAGIGLISSPVQPGLPVKYPAGLQCEWTLIAPSSRRVKLQFSQFNLQSTGLCKADFVEIIQDGENAEPSLSTIYCGEQLPPITVSTTNVLRLRFFTDDVVEGSGFSAFYDTVPVDDPDAPLLVWLEQNLADWTAKLQSLTANPADYISTGNVVTNTLLKHTPANWTALAADYHGRVFFWADPRLKIIWRGQLNGEQLVATPSYRGTSSIVRGITVDWLARTVYWTDAAYNHIMISNYEGSKTTVVIGDDLDVPTGIAVHPKLGWLFWTDTGIDPRIERSRLDGRDRQVIVNSESGYAVGLTVDYTHDRLYWTARSLDGTRSSIYWATLEGQSVTVYTTVDYNQYQFNDLTLYKNYLYVTDSTNQLHCYIKDKVRGFYFTFNLETRLPIGITTYAESSQNYGSSGCDANLCEFLCVGDGGDTYSCLCQQGFTAMQDGTCVADFDIQVPPPKVFVLGRTEICMYPANVLDLPSHPGQCILQDLPNAVAMATDARDGILFYSTLQDNIIYSIKLRNNERSVKVIGGTSEVNGIAVDWLDKLFYWTDSRLNHIAVSNYEGTHRRILLRDSVEQPGHIVIDPHARLIFWTYLGSSVEIERAALDGSNRVVIVRCVLEAGALTVDFDSQVLYFAEKGTGIRVTDYMGSTDRLLFQKGGSMFTGMDLYKDYLIWTERAPSNELITINKVNGEHVGQVSLDAAMESAYGVSMYANSRQRGGKNPCSDGLHDCEQLCLPAPLPSKFICTCATGYELDEDGTSCTSDLVTDNFILVADTYLHGIFQIDLSTPEATLQAIPLVNISNPLSVGYDPIQGLVFWSDVADGSISRATLHGDNQEVIVTAEEDQAPYSIVVDSNTRVVYWTDTMSNTIRGCRLDGTRQVTLVNTSRSPRALAVLPNEELLLWTRWGEDGTGIDKAFLDGSGRQTLVSAEEGFYHGLAIDEAEGKLYWTNGQAHSIESVDLSGNNYQVISLGMDFHPFGILLKGAHIYWTDHRSFNKLMQVDKATGFNVVAVGGLDLATPNGIYSNSTASQADISEDSEEALELTNQPHDVMLQIGMEIIQVCSSSQPSANIQWMKDGKSLMLGKHGNIYVFADGTLRILEVDETNSGLYTCIVTGVDGKVIQAHAEFQFDPDDIFLVKPEAESVIQEGDDLILMCIAREASYVIHWEKDGEPVQFSDMIHIISADNLIIRQAVFADYGMYTCYAETLDTGVRVSEVTAEVMVQSQEIVEEVCGRVTSPEATGIARGSTNATHNDNDDEDQTYRIIGGTTAKMGSSPWIARIWHTSKRLHFCSGALINRFWVLTAAHCITEYQVTKADIKIRLGDHDIYSTEENEQLIGVQHIKVHENFVPEDFDSDIALIKLDQPVEDFNDYLRPVCLPSKALARALLVSGRKGNVAGWGKLVEGDNAPYPRYLKEVAIPVAGQRKCRDSTTFLVTDNMFCAGYKKKIADACLGDSGGPFSIEHQGRWYQLGIVSWGEGCGRQGNYGFYTRLIKFLKWINQYVERH